MKKVTLAFATALLLGGVSFGQAAAPAAPVVTIGDWGRQIFAVGNQDGSGYWNGVGTSWGSNPRIVGLSITAHTDTVGFAISPCADNGTFGLTDENKAWINPLPGLTVESGLTLETDTWRGTGDFGFHDWIRLTGAHGDSYTFYRLGEGGFMSDVNYNKDGIGLWAGLENPTVGGNGAASTDFGSNLQAGAAYTIAGIGQVKAQYLGTYLNGAFAGINGAKGVVNAAFNLTAVKSLYEEVGVIVPVDASNADYAVEVSDVVAYNVAAATLHLSFIATDFNTNVGATSGLGLEAQVGANYDLGTGLGVGAAYEYVNTLELNNGLGTGGTATSGVLLNVTKGFSNGSIGIGFEYSATNWAGGNTAGVTAANSHWAVPVKCEEWF
jgi:hypothetical protein